MGARETDWKSDLNPEQREAVLHDDGPLLVLAGAGSGKTRVLTYRFARLVRDRGIPASHVLAVTFTNKAAGEMKERIEALVGPLPFRLWVGTFHSIGVRVLRGSASFAGVDPRFTIFDADDQRKLVKTICREQGLDPTSERVERVLAEFRRRKSSDGAARGRREGPGPESEGDFLFPFYESGLRRMNALDFDDLLARPVRLFRERPEVLASYADRFEHVLVDEFQDTNRIQNEMIRLLASSHGNICAVGDDDQSIYGWRGADVGNILRFEQTYPGARVVRLERNYRSTAPILEAAHAVIENNRGRRGKKLWTDRTEGEKVGLLRFRSERDEGLTLAREIQRRIDRSVSRARDFAIFYRTNAQSRALEEGLRSHAIPYVIVGGTRFYERKEVKDVLAYLRLVHNPKDDISFERVLNVPARGIGDKTRERLRASASSLGVSLLEAAARAEEIDDLGVRPKGLLRAFAAFIEKQRARAGEGAPPDGIAREIVEETRLAESFEEKEGEKGVLRAENVMEFVSGVADYRARHPEATLADFLAEVSLLTDVDGWEDGGDAVTLMTLHNSKGLEFPRVFIAGVEEGLLPHLLSTMDSDGVEEERRLFYVGLTRAKDKVVLSHTTSRLRYGEIAPASPSRFLDEIPEALLEEEDRTWGGLFAPRRGRPAPDDEPEPAHDAFPDYENESQEATPFRTGERIRHGTWGDGHITAVEGSGENTKITIAFVRGFTKKIMVRYASLVRLAGR